MRNDSSMPFGKYKGQPLSTVPGEALQYYLRWDQLNNGLKADMQEELNARRVAGENSPAVSTDVGELCTKLLRKAEELSVLVRKIQADLRPAPKVDA